MSGRIPARPARLVATLLATAAAFAITASAASAEVIYNSIPSPLPGNFASYGNEAYSNSQFGGEVAFAGTARKNPTVTVVMSSWACQSGNWSHETCETPKPAKDFRMPITFSIYEVGPGNTVGALIGTRSKRFKAPYRPSGSPKCAGGRWYDEETATCFHGKAFAISLKLNMRKLPEQAIVAVSYNTTDHGPYPVGETACNKTSEGCYYDSLNVAVSEPAEHTLSLGSDPTENLFVNSTYNEMYCGSEATLGTFGPTGTCFEGQQPVIEVSAN